MHGLHTIPITYAGTLVVVLGHVTTTWLPVPRGPSTLPHYSYKTDVCEPKTVDMSSGEALVGNSRPPGNG